MDWLRDWGIQGSVAAFAVFAILRGWIMPKRSVDALIAELRQRAEVAEQREKQWQAAWMAASAQLDALMVVGRVAETTLRALPTAAPEGASADGRS